MEDLTSIDGKVLKVILTNGALNLKNNIKIVNDLNVFPIPDGDTGDNMYMTIENGLKSIAGLDDENISNVAKVLARGMLFGARGNSGVILSQIFKGMSNALDGLSIATTMDFANAFIGGVNQAYLTVVNPVEGTILTVAREAATEAKKIVDKNTTIQKYLYAYLSIAEDVLSHTPEMLDVLKKANVIDSGGAGYVYIIEGMLKALNDEIIESSFDASITPSQTTKAFGPDSELEFGYCTEFILQLQNKKVDIKNFDINEITSYLQQIGDSIVALKDEDVVKVHVHTMNPGDVLNFGRKFGEFVTIKIENMTLQHNESVLGKQEHKEYGVVAVANGKGLEETFKEYGCDYIINGGQTMNPSTDDFIKVFESMNCDNIIVLPNNSNIIMAATQAKGIYDKANIIVIPTKTIAEGISALSMLNYDDPDFIEEINETIQNVITGEVTYAVRDTNLDGIDVKKNEFMGIIGKKLVSANNDKFEAAKGLIDYAIKEYDKEIITLIYGADVTEDDVNGIISYINKKYNYVDVTPINGGQDIYSFIISFE